MADKKHVDRSIRIWSRRAARPGHRPGRVGWWALCLATVVGAALLATSLAATPRRASAAPVARGGAAPAFICQKGSPSSASAYNAFLWTTLRQQIARGFHLTVAQLQAQVRARKSIQAVAAARHISARQLHTIEVQTLHATTDVMVHNGCMTRAGADEWVQYYVAKGSADLNARFTWWLTH